MTVNQISIFLENRYGKLNEILGLLADEGIRIIATTLADTSEFGIMRMIVTDPAKAYEILSRNNVTAHQTEVVAVVVPYEAGAFKRIIALFTDAGLNIEYMYGFSFREKSVLIVRTDIAAKAREVMKENRLECLGGNDLANL